MYVYNAYLVKNNQSGGCGEQGASARGDSHGECGGIATTCWRGTVQFGAGMHPLCIEKTANGGAGVDYMMQTTPGVSLVEGWWGLFGLGHEGRTALLREDGDLNKGLEKCLEHCSHNHSGDTGTSGRCGVWRWV